jgi:hypothetical protein
MDKVNRLALATAAAALGAAAAPTASAGISFQGPRLTGIALQSLEAHRLVVTAVRLPSGDDGAFPDGVGLRGPDGARIAAGTNDKPNTSGSPKRASDLGGVMVAAKPDPNPVPK